MATKKSQKRSTKKVSAKGSKTPKKSVASKNAAKTRASSTKARAKQSRAKPAIGHQPAAKNGAQASKPTRWAHPFYTATPQGQRPTVPGVGQRMTDHIKGTLEPVPAPSREPIFPLEEIIGKTGTDEIAAANSILFHTVGDTGRSANSPQGLVAAAMEKDFDITKPTRSPAFFFHLGDVVYHPNKDAEYKEEFYEPYVHYPGKIVAIPGNHDGEVFPTKDPVSLRAFLANFCAPQQAVPAIAGTIYRETMNQPSVYYLLDAPFVQIIALYSNAAENPGYISGDIPGQAQKQWLLKTLKQIATDRTAGKRKALVMATHHPPYTSGGHSASIEMLADIDDACHQAGVMPDMYLAGHAHSYQRYTRDVLVAGKSVSIPYVVVGTGGIGAQAVKAATNTKTDDHTYVSSFKGYGYMLVEVSNSTITGTMFEVDEKSGARTQFEQFVVNFQNSTVQTR